MSFYNPYNFIPALPREDAVPGELRRRLPAGHDRWYPQLWSGRIAVRMMTITPLLLVNATLAEDAAKGHHELTVATVAGEDGTDRVDLAPTQIKGMLRAAFEAVTNSRFGVVSKDHHSPLGYRSGAASGSGLHPVIVEQIGGKPRVTVLGTLRPGNGLAVVPGAVLDGWRHASVDARTASASLGRLCHRQHVEAWLTGETITTPKGQMCRWRVTELVAVGDRLPAKPAGGGPWARVYGYLHLTGPTISGKRWERLFVTKLLPGSDSGVSLEEHRTLAVDQSAELLGALRQLITHQRGIHTSAGRDGIWDREDPARTPRMPWEFFGHEPGSTAWSRHLYDVSGRPRTAPAAPAPGWTGPDVPLPPPGQTVYTCWAESPDGSRLRPVMVSRLLYDRAPIDLLDLSLHPAPSLEKLSPADRVFGWVAPPGAPPAARRAYRGQLRVVKVVTPVADEKTITRHSPGKILPALSSPKPSQGRFYLSETTRRGPQPVTSKRADFFTDRQALRGRKVYLYRQGSPGDQVTPSRTAFDAKPTSQNSTVRSWVNTGIEFRFELIVDNLNDLELGALLWLLDPHRLGRDEQPGRHRLGMGKPYGFGVVELSMDTTLTALARGELIDLRLRTLDPAPADDKDWADLAERFEKAVAGQLAPVLAAVRTAAVGVGANSQLHYPYNQPGDDGYAWFDNEERKPADTAQGLPLLGTTTGTLRGNR